MEHTPYSPAEYLLDYFVRRNNIYLLLCPRVIEAYADARAQEAWVRQQIIEHPNKPVYGSTAPLFNLQIALNEATGNNLLQMK